jgi:5-methylcytosine-specific restriction endonuclease McrBC regulatory subunit McrC
MAPKPLKRGGQRGQRIRRLPLIPLPLARDICLELQDNSVIQKSAVEFFTLRGVSRDPTPVAARLAEQFEAQNRPLFSLMDIRLSRLYDGSNVHLRLEAGNVIGAIPLFSPTSGLRDYGIVVQPRFPWPGIGPMLAAMGWRVAPSPLRLPLLKRSERKVPTWVISCMVLARLKALLDSISRRFELTYENRSAPRGTVHWTEYATRYMATGQFLSIPCSFPDLRDDPLLVGAIRYSLEKHLRSLESQREQGAFVHQLIAFCNELLRRVQHISPFLPSPATVASWLQRPLRSQHFQEGLQAIEWTTEDRGLAGVSDLEGIPWRMPMEEFFEAWVETVFHSIAREIGGDFRVGRRKETVHPINWEPSYLGSQTALAPDVWITMGSTTVIVDAKYKRHWEELQDNPWASAEELMKEQHRNDLFQVLAYANLARTPRVIVCLAYPCKPETWNRMVERNRLFHKAEINTGTRSVLLWLTAIPMATSVEKIAIPLLREIRSAAA